MTIVIPADPAADRRRSRRRWCKALAFALVLALAGLVLVSQLQGPQPTRSVLINKPAPGLTGTTLQQQPFDLSTWRGEVVLVNVWASWCVPCQREQPLLVQTAQELGPLGLRIVGINVRDTVTAAREFQQKYGDGDWPSVQDPDGERAVDWGTFALPETYLVNRDGIIVAKAVGELESAWIQDHVRPLLVDQGPEQP